jgi:transketolase
VATFGESAPGEDLFEHFGLTAGRLADEVRRVLDRSA